MSDRWATFDCYGTLIDWNGGLRSALARLWPHSDADRLLELYHLVEPRIEQRGEPSYREVLARGLAAVAAIDGLRVPAGREDALGESLASWAPFAEVPDALGELRAHGWKLAVLSNTDPDLLASSIAALGVAFDLTVSARDAGSYKPAPGHWKRFFAESEAERRRHVHVAASLFHDIEPVARIGLTALWINRLGEDSEVGRAAERPDLEGLADVLDGLVRA